MSEGHDSVAVAQPALLTEVSPASGGLHRGTSLLRGATDVRARKFVCGHPARCEREGGKARPCAKIRCPLLRSAGMPFPRRDTSALPVASSTLSWTSRSPCGLARTCTSSCRGHPCASRVVLRVRDLRRRQAAYEWLFASARGLCTYEAKTEDWAS